MSRIEEVLNAKKKLIAGHGASEKDICSAEEQLNIKFALEYRDYLLRYGAVSYGGREFTGITPIERINVVSVTEEERARDIDNRESFYVIEQTGMDDIVIWQNEEGKIYKTYGIEAPKQIYNSLEEFFSL